MRVIGTLGNKIWIWLVTVSNEIILLQAYVDMVWCLLRAKLLFYLLFIMELVQHVQKQI